MSANVKNYISNTTFVFTPDANESFTCVVTCDEGFIFDEATDNVCMTYTDKKGFGKSLPPQYNDAHNVATFVCGTDKNRIGETDDNLYIRGATKEAPQAGVTNNVPNSTDNSAWQGESGDGDFWYLKLNANSGYKFDGDITATYTDTGGQPQTLVLTPRNALNLEVWAYVYNTDANTHFEVNGNTRSDNELDVTNNVADTTATGEKSGNASAKVTLTADEGFTIQSARVAFTDGNGDPASEDMTISEGGKSASWQNDDCEPDEGVTLTGTTAREGNGVNIETNFSNCYADPPLPEFLQYGETLNVTVKANENTAFDTEQSTPDFFYYDEQGDPTSKDLTVSGDKKTATGSIVIQDGWYNLSVNAQAYPVAVVGEQYGAINVYLVTLDELAEFSKKRFFKETGSDPETGAAIYENIDLSSYVNRIRRVYTDIGASSTDVIRCGNYNTGVSCRQPTTDKITLDFGTAQVPAHNEDNTDYESEIQIFLPFAGFVNLNNDYAGKTIALQYVINVVTGNGVALLSCNGVIFQVEETEPSSEIIYLSPGTQVKTVGGDDWNEMLYYGLEPYIYCKWYESASEGRNTDRQTGILGEFRGFNVFDDVTPVHTAEMLAEEQEMIYTALSDGVYIE